MSTIAKRTIYVGAADSANSKPLNIEGLAVAATKPGSIVGVSASGLTKLTDSTGDYKKQVLVADKDQMRSKSVDTDWTIAESMVAIAPRSGDFMNCLVITAQTIVVGAPLARSATAGALKLADGTGTDEIVGYADETVTTTATQLVAVRIA